MKISIINGPNLNLTGKREEQHYGQTSLTKYFNHLQKKYSDVQLDFYQSNIEGELIDKLHEAGFSADGIILNAGGYTHTSVAIGDAVKAIKTPVVEVHISNVFKREPFRHESFISAGASGTITGLGLAVYELALKYFTEVSEG
jgi:3-dehydroquinate dehydratase-2